MLQFRFSGLKLPNVAFTNMSCRLLYERWPPILLPMTRPALHSMLRAFSVRSLPNYGAVNYDGCCLP
jgi:hypothetical protein